MGEHSPQGAGAPLDRLLHGLLGAEPSPQPGLQRLVGRLQEHGLGEQVQSWIGGQGNRPVAPQQLHHALGEHRLQQLAQELGLTPVALSALLARFLPLLVDGLTPQGRLPAPGNGPGQGDLRNLTRDALRRVGNQIENEAPR